MAKGIPMRRFRPVLWGDRDMAVSGAERLGRPVVFVGRMEGEGRGSGPGSVGKRGAWGTPWGGGHREAEGHRGRSARGEGGDQLVTDGRSPRLESVTNHRVTASWKANDLEKDSVFRT